MFDFLNNPWETDEQKRQKLNNSQTQTPFNGQQTPMTPRQMVEQAWDQSVAKQEAKEQAYKPMESMSTHDAAEYAWAKSLAEQEAKKSSQEYKLGTLSGRGESNNNYCAVGGDQNGGYSFGKYQIATKPGTMQDYIKYLNQNQQYKSFANNLNNAGGNQAALRGDKAFINEWQKLCKDDDFNQAQENFIFKTHYIPIKNKLNKIPGLNIDKRNPVVKDVVFSSAVQHRGNTPTIFQRAFPNQSLSQMSDEDIINGIYNERKNTDRYFSKSTPSEQNSVKKRLEEERLEALRLLGINQ